jgi:hypothetical protein
MQSGSPSCECAANTSGTVYADPIYGSNPGSSPFPSGVQNPPQCRIKTLTSANSMAGASLFSPKVVIATGFTGTNPVVFSNETWPFIIKPNVLIKTSDTTPTPANYIIDYNNGSGGITTAFTIQAGTTLSGFTLRNAGGNPNATMLQLCGAGGAGTATLLGGVVQAKAVIPASNIANGVFIGGGGCSASISNMDILNATQTGLQVSSTVASLITINGGTYDSNTVGVVLYGGTVSFNNIKVRNSTFHGIQDVPNGADVKLSISNSLIENNNQSGLSIAVGSATAASTVQVANTEVRGNGVAGGGVFYDGVDISARTMTMDTVNIHDNAAGGLVVLAGAMGTPGVVVTGVSHFDNNGAASGSGHGVLVTGAGAGFTATGATFSGNHGPGFGVSMGATGTLHGGVVSNNGIAYSGGGLEVQQAIVQVDQGTSFNHNAYAGIRVYSSGNVTLTGTMAQPIDVGFNGLATMSSGANISPSQLSATFVNFHDNGSHGARVFDVTTAPYGAPMSFTSCAFGNNAGSGLFVEGAGIVAVSLVPSLTVTGSQFNGNLHGIDVAATTADVHASFNNNTITGAADTGIHVNGTPTSQLTFGGNIISNNNAAASLDGGLTGGGMVMTGSAPGLLNFTSNVIHHNTSNQILVTGTGTWNLSATAALACDATRQNVIACYDGSPAPPSAVGIAADGAGVVVQVNGEAWQNKPPSSPADYNATNGATITPPPASCGPSTITCP